MNGAARQITITAMMTAMLIGGQVALSMIVGVEVVTVLLCAYSCVFGVKQGMLTATSFSLLRCFVFGFFPNVIVLYLVYYNLFALCFGLLGKSVLCNPPIVAVLAAVLTVCFTLIDCVLSPIMTGVNPSLYFAASILAMSTQVANALITCVFLYVPLSVAFKKIKNSTAIRGK